MWKHTLTFWSENSVLKMYFIHWIVTHNLFHSWGRCSPTLENPTTCEFQSVIWFLLSWNTYLIGRIVKSETVLIQICNFLFQYGKVLKSADPLVIFTFLTMYGIATIALSFLLSTFFSKANLSAASGGIIFFLLYLPYSFMVRWILRMSPLSKTLLVRVIY